MKPPCKKSSWRCSTKHRGVGRSKDDVLAAFVEAWPRGHTEAGLRPVLGNMFLPYVYYIMYTYIYIYILCIYIYIFFVCICIYICVYICIYIYTCIYVYIYIYKWTVRHILKYMLYIYILYYIKREGVKHIIHKLCTYTLCIHMMYI